MWEQAQHRGFDGREEDVGRGGLQRSVRACPGLLPFAQFFTGTDTRSVVQTWSGIGPTVLAPLLRSNEKGEDYTRGSHRPPEWLSHLKGFGLDAHDIVGIPLPVAYPGVGDLARSPRDVLV